MNTIQLTPEIEDLIAQQIKTGKYQDDLAVIEEGLRLLAERDRIYRGRFEQLKQEVMIGVQELRRGESFDGREFINRLKATNLQDSGSWIMTVILISSKAKEDLEIINDRIAYSNIQAANQLLDKILGKFEILASFPNMGKNRNELIMGWRSFPVEDYLIFYFPLENGIEIARVVRGYRDLDAMFDLD